jgi:hypothetical protein
VRPTSYQHSLANLHLYHSHRPSIHFLPGFASASSQNCTMSSCTSFSLFLASDFTVNYLCSAGLLSSQDMCSSCRRCKLRAEKAYKNLDDHQKYFLMPMKGDFQQAMVFLTYVSLCFMECLLVMFSLCFLVLWNNTSFHTDDGNEVS